MVKQIQSLLVQWYEEKKRNLPWRETQDPYLIWLSEIILQQTRVDQGMDYYLKFKYAFPTIKHLANATEMEVLNLWKGLGYYSRARNLHASAKYILEKHNGEFPKSYNEIIKLKGVGFYTAAAISSFAFNEPKAVLDGNVFRVLSRLFANSTPIDSAQGKKEFMLIAEELLDKQNVAQHNQAIMEFGAIQCVPVNPKCDVCPFDFLCEAKSKNLIKTLPVKKGKAKITDKFYVFQIYKKNKKILLEKRVESGIWKNMYQLPLIEFNNSTEKKLFLQREKFNFVSEEIKHILSHQHLYCHFVEVHEIPSKEHTNQIWVSSIEISDFPVPRIIDKFIEEHFEKIFF